MGLKTLLFITLFFGACIGTLHSPIWPMLGYLAHYAVGPERQWWYAPLRPLGIRCSFTLGGLTALSLLLYWGNLRFGRSVLSTHEKWLLAFVGVVWLSAFIGPETVGRYSMTSGVDHPVVKLTKVAVFTLMMTHVASDLKNLNRLIWVLILGAAVLGMQAWATPYSSFVSGRLERVGGPDFAEANFFAAYMACMLWIIGAQFLRSEWRGKIVCFVAGGFTANAVVLSRSRGAMVGLAAGGLAALLMAPPRYRRYIFAGLVLAGLGFLRLADEQFLDRMTTIFAAEEDRDASAQNRVRLAEAGLSMWQDHPLGVGAGNFYQFVGRYLPTHPGTDAHNTYIRCLTELGAQGLFVFVAIIISAMLILLGVRRDSHDLPQHLGHDMAHLSYGMICALATLIASFLTISLTYVEFSWWFLMLPMCLRRTVDNLQQELAEEDEDDEEDDSSTEQPRFEEEMLLV